MAEGDALRLNVSARSGRVRVEARDEPGFEVKGAHVVTEPDGSLHITAAKGGSQSVEVWCPSGSDLIVGSESGSVEVVGAFGDVRATTRSGRITVDWAHHLDVRTTSGRIEIGQCSGDCRVVTKSSRIKVGRAATFDCSAMSGRVDIGDVDDAVIRTMSGRVNVGTRSDGRVDVRTLSGAVEVAVPAARRPATLLKTVSGRVRSECEEGSDGEINVSTTSGTIKVTCG
jgi:DUF4097 and DUF4098 domain-containing protein YvlB